MAALVLSEVKSNDVPTPPAGKVAIYFDEDLQVMMVKKSDGSTQLYLID